jgi:hypothetical protein
VEFHLPVAGFERVGCQERDDLPKEQDLEKSEAFFKGGCGCLVVFFVVAIFGGLLGAESTINCGGAVMLFVLGGLLGWVALTIYEKGRQDQRNEDREDLSEL